MPESLRNHKWHKDTIDTTLATLLSDWEKLQAELENISKTESPESDCSELIDRDEKEDSIQEKQNSILQKIIEFECSSIDDVVEKLRFWQRSKLLGNDKYNQYSLTDQIALSISL